MISTTFSKVFLSVAKILLISKLEFYLVKLLTNLFNKYPFLLQVVDFIFTNLDVLFLYIHMRVLLGVY